VGPPPTSTSPWERSVLHLPDVVAPELDAVFCGTAVGDCQALAGHHHAVPGDAFWSLLHQSGLTPRLLAPDEEDLLPGLGLGIADLFPRTGTDAVVFDVDELADRLTAVRPRWVVLTSKRTGAAVARALGHRPPPLGVADWTYAGARVFVAPSTSRANQRRDYDGRPTRLAWWSECAGLVRAAG
jgi:TDG/mug DNA glycosylase family protein